MEIHGFLAWFISSNSGLRENRLGMDSGDLCSQFVDSDRQRDRNRDPVAFTKPVCVSHGRFRGIRTARLLRNTCVAAISASNRSHSPDIDSGCSDRRKPPSWMRIHLREREKANTAAAVSGERQSDPAGYRRAL